MNREQSFPFSFVPSPLLVETERQEEMTDSLLAQIGWKPAAAVDTIKLDGRQMGMEELRQAFVHMRHKPLVLPKRIFLIQNFEFCNRSIQNALLKTLEEPSEILQILLLTKSASKLLGTLRSRCLFYRDPVGQASGGETESWEFFEKLAQADEISNFSELEIVLKSRDKALEFFRRSLHLASQKSYPGHWQQLAPHLVEGIAQLERNLNPKSVWEAAWARSLEEPT